MDLMSIFLSFKGWQLYAFMIGLAEFNSPCEFLFYVYAPQFWFGRYFLENSLTQKTYSQAVKFHKIQNDSGMLRRVDW